jgi:hypothetical protein
MPIRKKPTRSKLVAQLDTVFSTWVRSSGADHAGRAACYTCGKVQPWKEMDAGHFQTRMKYSTRWDEQNVKPQCKHCNMTNGGHQYEFALQLDRDYGPGTAEQVLRRSNELRKFSSKELQEMTALYRDKLRSI